MSANELSPVIQTCYRCSGNGYYWVKDEDDPRVYPGDDIPYDCLRCGGSGKIVIGSKEKIMPHDSRESEDDFGDNKSHTPPPPPPMPSKGCYRAGEREVLFQNEAEEAVRTLLKWMGQDINDATMKDTPGRVVKALAEMTSGYQEYPDKILSKTFGDEKDHDEMVILKGIPFASMCSHHLLPFVGEVDIGYLPGKVVGLSKLARLVDCFAKRIQMQETLTTQIADSLMKYLEARGAAVVIKASHSCMSCRGLRKPGAMMITSRMVGLLRDNPEARAEFLQLCRE